MGLAAEFARLPVEGGGLDVEGFDEFDGGDELAAVVVEIGTEVLDHRRHGSGRSRAGGFRQWIEELRQLAADRDVQPTALIRAWVLAQLDAAHSPDDYAQRWEREVRATADQLRQLLDERPGAPWADVS